MAYLRIKWIKGNPYLYEQTSYRVGPKVKTRHIRYIGRYGYGRSSGGGQSSFTPPEALTAERKKYIDSEIDRLQLGSRFPYHRDVLRQYLYHQSFEFSGASGRKSARGRVTVSGSSFEVMKFELQGKSDPFVWMHEMGHALEFADKMIDTELDRLRHDFVGEIRQAYIQARAGDLEAKESFIKQYASLIDLRSDSTGGVLHQKPLEERPIYRRLELVKLGAIPEQAFEYDFRRWVFAEYRLTDEEIFADSVAALVLDRKQAFAAHTGVGRRYLTKVYVRLYTHLENKYKISLSQDGEPK